MDFVPKKLTPDEKAKKLLEYKQLALKNATKVQVKPFDAPSSDVGTVGTIVKGAFDSILGALVSGDGMDRKQRTFIDIGQSSGHALFQAHASKLFSHCLGIDVEPNATYLAQASVELGGMSREVFVGLADVRTITWLNAFVGDHVPTHLYCFSVGMPNFVLQHVIELAYVSPDIKRVCFFYLKADENARIMDILQRMYKNGVRYLFGASAATTGGDGHEYVVLDFDPNRTETPLYAEYLKRLPKPSLKGAGSLFNALFSGRVDLQEVQARGRGQRANPNPLAKSQETPEFVVWRGLDGKTQVFTHASLPPKLHSRAIFLICIAFGFRVNGNNWTLVQGMLKYLNNIGKLAELDAHIGGVLKERGLSAIRSENGLANQLVTETKELVAFLTSRWGSSEIDIEDFYTMYTNAGKIQSKEVILKETVHWQASLIRCGFDPPRLAYPDIGCLVEAKLITKDTFMIAVERDLEDLDRYVRFIGRINEKGHGVYYIDPRRTYFHIRTHVYNSMDAKSMTIEEFKTLATRSAEAIADMRGDPAAARKLETIDLPYIAVQTKGSDVPLQEVLALVTKVFRARLDDDDEKDPAEEEPPPKRPAKGKPKASAKKPEKEQCAGRCKNGDPCSRNAITGKLTCKTHSK